MIRRIRSAAIGRHNSDGISLFAVCGGNEAGPVVVFSTTRIVNHRSTSEDEKTIVFICTHLLSSVCSRAHSNDRP